MLRLVNLRDLSPVTELRVPVLVIGSGVAGLSAALEAANRFEVLLLTKAEAGESNTSWAQGGVAAVFSPKDSVASHVQDTLHCGRGLCHEEVVRAVVKAGRGAIERLIEWGGSFDRLSSGELRLGMEGGHTAERIIHAGGDATGNELQSVLLRRVAGNPRIRLMEHTIVLDLVVHENRVLGAIGHHDNRYLLVRAAAVICATGGCGQVFRESTNPEIATGDGLALLARAGVILRGMEFVQFHPTTLYIAGSSRMLISEAVRGEGGILRDKNGVAFMEGLHPRKELAARDFVSRAVLQRIVETGHTNVYLDVRHLPPEFIRSRFPQIDRVCRNFGLDITRDPIPVAPAAHYMIGGAVVDIDGRTNLRRLFAVGEVSCTGLHGANRLASNSLLEGLVLGVRVGHAAAECASLEESEGFHLPETRAPTRWQDPHFSSKDLCNSMKSLMWRHVGILRDGTGLAEADRRLESWQTLADSVCRNRPREWEIRNMLLVSRLITAAACARSESRGVHFRTDFPQEDARSCEDLEVWLNDENGIDIRWVPIRAGIGSGDGSELVCGGSGE